MSLPRRGPAWLAALPRPIRSGHRGAAGLVAANTLASYAEAVRLGCDLIEMDVQPDANGEIILLHDNVVTVDGVPCPVATLTLAELRRHASPDIPTLAEALDLLRGRAVPLLDLKGVGFEVALADAVRAAGLDAAIVCGRPLASLLATHAANPAIATSLTFDTGELLALDPAAIAAIPTDAVTVNYRRLTPELIAAFQGEGLTVLAWTVDEPAAMQAQVGANVDGITTNRPDLLAAAFRRE